MISHLSSKRSTLKKSYPDTTRPVNKKTQENRFVDNNKWIGEVKCVINIDVLFWSGGTWLLVTKVTAETAIFLFKPLKWLNFWSKIENKKLN